MKDITNSKECRTHSSNINLVSSMYLLVISIVVLGCHLSAFAHEDEQLEEVIVKGRWDKPTGYLTSASQGIVGQAEIDIRPRLRTGEILEVVPGLIVTQHSGSGKSNQMFLRGFNLDHGTDFATWIDGMPINNPTHGHGQGYTDLNFLIPELIQSIEFVKGPYHAEIGDFASAGAAHLTTMRSLDAGLAKIGFGGNGYAKALIGNSLSVGDGDLLFGLQGHFYDGPWVGVEEDLKRYNGMVKYSGAGRNDSEWNVTLMAYDAEWDSADQVPQRGVEQGLVSELGTIDDTVGGASSRYSLSGSWHRDFNTSSINARAYWIDYELGLFSNFTYFLDDPINGDQFEQVDQRNIFGGDVTIQFDQSNASHVLGLALRADRIDEVGLYKTSLRQRLSTLREDEVQSFNIGLYYEYAAQLTQRWRAEAGTRLDYFDFNVRQSNIAANTGSEKDFQFSPKLNIVYSVNENLELNLSAGRGFHSNDARGTTLTIDPTTGGPAETVDPLVSSLGAEVGVRWFQEQKINAAASLWYLELDSELLFVGDAGNTEASRPSRRYGVELPIYYKPNSIWTLDMELALSEAEFTDNDPANQISGAIDTVVSAGASAQLSNGVYGSVRLRYFGERPLDETGLENSGSSTVFNASLGLRKDKFDLRLDMLNLFDSDDDDITYFYQSRLPGEPIDGFEDRHFHPIEPRTVRASIIRYF